MDDWDEPARLDRLCELNVIEQAIHVCETTVVQDAWERGQDLTVHSVIYSLHDGLLRDLGLNASNQAGIRETYAGVMKRYRRMEAASLAHSSPRR